MTRTLFKRFQNDAADSISKMVIDTLDDNRVVANMQTKKFSVFLFSVLPLNSDFIRVFPKMNFMASSWSLLFYVSRNGYA